MKIVPVTTAPAVVKSPVPTTNQSSKRSAAMAAFNAASQTPSPPATGVDQLPVRNPGNISPEELSAVKPTPSGQNHSDVEAPSSETSEPNEAPKAPEDPISSQYATLARKEKTLRARQLQQEAAFKAREEAFAAKEREFATKSTIDQSQYIQKDKLTADPLSTLNELGLSYDKLVELAMNQPNAQEIERLNYQKKIETELKALRDEQERSKKSYEDAQTQQYAQALKQIRNEANQLISSDATFETIKATNSVDDVVDLIERTFKEDGNLLTVEEAAREVEEYLVEEAMKLVRISKIQQRMKPTEKPAVEKQTVAPQQQLKTLTNSVSSTRQLSARERAIARFKGELN